MPEPLTGSLFDIDGFGTLTCECGIFPVIDGIPILDRRHNEQRLVALLKQGAFSTAASECLMVDIWRAPRLLRLFWRALRKFDVPNGLYERIKMCRTFREEGQFRIAGASDGKPISIVAPSLREFKQWLSVLVKAFRVTDYTLVSLLVEGPRASAHWHARIQSKITGVTVATEFVDLVEVTDGAIARYTEFFVPR